MQECRSEPHIQRHRDGWRYNVVRESGIVIRKGPSLSAECTDEKLLVGESVLINERVTPPGGGETTWLRLKDGRGWAHDTGADREVVMIAHSLHHRTNTKGTHEHKNPSSDETKDVAYNAIIARLFQSEQDPNRRSTEDKM
mmetsp:Transcript_13050/g.30349  ORF Transcript_13050/g.30349 Transcript_13050/m.30349 type:complete len:141 (+) Transcript_13050:1428-1850(+)